jgi:hypothetical protein
MKFVSGFAGTTMLPVDFQPGPVNAVAHAARRADGKVLLAILNKDQSQPLNVALPRCTLSQVLTAPSLTAQEAHLLEGAAAAALVKMNGGTALIPKATGAMFLLA